MALFEFDERFAQYYYSSTLNQFLSIFLSSATGDQLKVYLYGLIQCFDPMPTESLEALCRELHMDEAAVTAAFDHWAKVGLIGKSRGAKLSYHYFPIVGPVTAPDMPPQKPKPARAKKQPAAPAPAPKEEPVSDSPAPKEHTVLTDKPVPTRTFTPEEGPGYALFCGKMHMILSDKRALKEHELQDAYTWITSLGFEPAAVYLIFNYMLDVYGPDFYMTMASDLVADLYHRDIKTYKKALTVLSTQRTVVLGARRVLARFGMTQDAAGNPREPSEGDLRFYAQWLKLGFTAEAIEAACAETVKGDPSFAYLNAILRTMASRLEHAPRTAQEVAAYFSQMEEDAAPLKEIISIMNLRIKVNQATLSAYQSMRVLYPHEIIVLAARECSVEPDATLETVHARLTLWSKRGLKTAEDVAAYLARRKRLDADVRDILIALNLPPYVKDPDRNRVQRWQDDLHLPQELILYCAPHAADADKPMLYLDKLLREYAKQGALTPSRIDEARAAFQRQHQKPRLVREQQYTQRDYPDDDPAKDLQEYIRKFKEDFPDWTGK